MRIICIPSRSDVAQWIEYRDLGKVLAHEEPLPHPVSDQAQ
jgi:hypothetical protein